MFKPWNITSYAGWVKEFKDNPPPPGIIYSFDLKEYKPSEPKPDAEPEVVGGTADSPWT